MASFTEQATLIVKDQATSQINKINAALIQPPATATGAGGAPSTRHEPATAEFGVSHRKRRLPGRAEARYHRVKFNPGNEVTNHARS